MSEDLLKKCRTCLSDSHIFHKLSDYVDENYKILEMLDGIVPQIDIKATTKLSSYVCQPCVDKLLIGYKFQQLCIETNSRLHDLMGIVVFETAPKLKDEKLLDPLTGEASLKLKQEVEDEACFECEIEPVEFISMESVSDNDTDNASDFSNEKLSVFKGNKSKNYPTTPTELEKPNKNNQRKQIKNNERTDLKDENDIIEEIQSFQCPDCPKLFEKKSSLSAHCKVHINKTNKDPNNEEFIDEVAKSKVIVKMEIEVSPHIFEEPMDDLNADAEWCSNDYEDSDDNSEKNIFTKPGTEHTKNLEFIDTGIEEIEKPNDSEKISYSLPCELCGKVFKSQYHLKRHSSSVHAITKPHECEICKYRFPTKKYLTNHLKQHEDILVYQSQPEGFKCPDCPKLFKKKTNLSAHRQIHARNGADANYPCKVCQRNFLSVMSLIEHITNKHPEVEKHKCDQCDKTFVLHAHLIEHLNIQHTKNLEFIDTGIVGIEKPNDSDKISYSFPCELCGKVFKSPYHLKRHSSSVHSITQPHECEICKYRFPTKKYLKNHLKQHEDILVYPSQPEGFKCPDCPRLFKKKAYLSAHRQIHARNGADAKFPCKVCQRNFLSVISLIEHITNKHPEVEKHKCDQCDKTFVLHAHLVEHLNRHTGNTNVVCLICEKEFGNTNTLNEHMRTHIGESPHLCPQCGKIFRTAGNLRQHVELHAGLKKYQCTECPSRFNCSSGLSKHIKTHSNAKPYVCDMCGSRFTRGFSLRKHMLSHSGERPFKCDQCSMTFVIKNLLTRHMRTHTGEKPYKCKYCERAYAASGDLTKHLRTHVGENTYMCDQCPVAFKYQAELKQHQAEHYRMARKLLQQAQKMPQNAQQHEIAEQTHHHQPQQQLPTIVEETQQH